MEQPDQYGLFEDEKADTGPERIAAFHSTILAMNTHKPCGGLFTYNREEDLPWGQYLLAKILPYVQLNGELLAPSQTAAPEVYDLPGSITGKFRYGSVTLTMELFPLLFGREKNSEEGGGLCRITTSPASPVEVRIGGGKRSDMVGWKKVRNEEGKMVDLMTVMTRAAMVSEKFREKEARVEVQNQYAFLHSAHPYTVAVTSQGKMTKEQSPEGSPYLAVAFPGGSGTITLAFDRQAERAKALAACDTAEELAKSLRYYQTLVSSKIETPDPKLNFAFTSAIYNLDYNFLSPYGWVEAVHHWLSIWHQQHSLAADWLDQGDRAKAVLRSQGARLYPDGAAPMLLPNGHTFRAFGGTDHFYLWQARHYLLHTNDTAFAKEILPTLETVTAHCFAENDPDGNHTLHWGEQIGNQEDYISHLHTSASPTIEGINMLESLALAASLAGEENKSSRYKALAQEGRENLAKLWDKDLGRFIYGQDTSGKRHPEGQYQTYSYPTLYEMVEEADSYTSLRHLRDRLIGQKGELYCSNDFPNHMTATLGTQAGAAQQPWGAMALAKMGLNEEAIRPLQYIADFVADPEGCAGSWPETAEVSCAYFSPPAGVFIQAVIEGIFGLKMDAPAGKLTLSPCLPESWPEAALTLPKYQMRCRREDTGFFIELQTQQALIPCLEWRLPFGIVEALEVNGQASDYTLLPRVGGLLLRAQLPKGTYTKIRLQFTEIPLHISCPKTAAQGSSFTILAKDFQIAGLCDRSGICSGFSLQNAEEAELTLRRDILVPYQKFGALGQLNFSRRTVFLELVHQSGQKTVYPLDLTILPPLEAAGALEGNTLSLTLRKNAPLADTGTLLINGQALPLSLTESAQIMLPPEAVLLPGRNAAAVFHSLGNTEFMVKSTQKVPTAPVELPQEALAEHTCWKGLRHMPYLPHMPWLNQKDPLLELETTELTHPELPVTFHITKDHFAPLCWKSHPRLELPLQGEYRKFYILLLPFLDHHDIYSPVLRITARRTDGKLTAREYSYPGDLDGFWSVGSVGCFATAHSFEKRGDGLLPAPGLTGDWHFAKPAPDNIYYFTKEYGNSFPASSMWCGSYTLRLPNSYANILEMDLGKYNELEALILEPVGTQPAFGILAVEAI